MKNNSRNIFDNIKEYFYPGIKSLDISPLDGTLMFYNRVYSLCPSKAIVLDYGASAGDSLSLTTEAKRNLMLLKPYSITRIGVDVDVDIEKNQFLDRYFILDEKNGFKIPLEDSSVDLVIADWVIEHLPNPIDSYNEIYRVLKNGGWFCARTANIYHYSYAIANLVKNTSFERKLLNASQGERYTWPKAYKSNTSSILKKLLKKAHFEKIIILNHEPEPTYLMKNIILFIFGLFWQKFATFGILPKANLLIYSQKK